MTIASVTPSNPGLREDAQTRPPRRENRHCGRATDRGKEASSQSCEVTHRNLLRLGVEQDLAIKQAFSRKGYWRLSQTPALRNAMPNSWLDEQGLLSLKQLWCDLAPLRGTA